MTDDAFDLADPGGATPRDGAAPLSRSYVAFRTSSGAPTAPLDVAGDFAGWLKSDAKSRGSQIKARVHATHGGAVTARVYWRGGRFYSVGFKMLADGQLLARHNGAGGRPLSRLLQEWLAASDRFTDACWRTSDEFNSGDPGQPAP
jgi:hypothetical protein